MEKPPEPSEHQKRISAAMKAMWRRRKSAGGGQRDEDEVKKLRAALAAFVEHFGPIEDNEMLNDGARKCFKLARAALGETV